MATPKPIIAHVLKTLRVPPGMVYALVTDLEQNLWVVESCPAGTRFWTLEQAADLSQGPRTHSALQQILNLGRSAQRRQTVEAAERQSARQPVPLRSRRDRDVSTDRSAPHRQTVERVRTLSATRNLVEV